MSRTCVQCHQQPSTRLTPTGRRLCDNCWDDLVRHSGAAITMALGANAMGVGLASAHYGEQSSSPETA